MDSKQLHTFVIMAYKTAPYLEPTIQSILSQSVKSSIILTTSTPNDRILGLAQQYSIPVFINPEPKGIAKDWSYAISCAKTPYITLADQDDIYLPDYAEQIIKMINHNPDCIMCFTNYKELDHNGKIRKLNLTMVIKHILLLSYYVRPVYRSRQMKELILRFGDPICSPSITFNMNIIKDHPMFDANYSIALDWDAWMRLAQLNGAFCFCRKALLHHRIHEGTQTTTGIQGGKRYNEDLDILTRLWPKWLARFILLFYSRSYHSN